MSDCSQETNYLASPEFMVLASHCLAGIQIPVFLFGSYCILFKTPDSMASVKWLLLNTHFWSSLSDFIICFLGLPYLFIPALAGYGLGVMNNPGLAIYLLITVTAYSGVSLLSIYENRYFILFGRKTWWRHYRKSYFISIYILVPFMFIPPYFNVPDQETARIQVFRSIPCLPKYAFGDRKMYILSLDYVVPVACVTCASLLLGVSLIIFLYLTFWKIWIDSAWTASRQTQVLQKSFTKGVTVQTVYEFFILLIPVVTLLAMIIFCYHNQIINNFAFLVVSLNGVGSTIIMLSVHKPYRTFTLSVYCVFCPKISHKDHSNATELRSKLSAIS